MLSVGFSFEVLWCYLVLLLVVSYHSIWCLEEEAEADCEEDDTDSNDSNNPNNLGKNSNIVDNIVHPTIDTNAKWILVNLFKNNLKLPF